MRLLILGGTADGRQLAEILHRQGVPLIYSVAGLVRTPKVACEVVSGGFSQFGGLVEYSQQQGITAILDVTHPYAAKMSATAVSAAKRVVFLAGAFIERLGKNPPPIVGKSFQIG